MKSVWSLANEHSHTRTTFHPLLINRRVFLRSRFRVLLIFSRHKATLVRGVTLRPQSWPCQKQPSINSASFNLGHTKSGLPTTSACLRHPVIPCALKIA